MTNVLDVAPVAPVTPVAAHKYVGNLPKAPVDHPNAAMDLRDKFLAAMRAGSSAVDNLGKQTTKPALLDLLCTVLAPCLDPSVPSPTNVSEDNVFGSDDDADADATVRANLDNSSGNATKKPMCGSAFKGTVCPGRDGDCTKDHPVSYCSNPDCRPTRLQSCRSWHVPLKAKKVSGNAPRRTSGPSQSKRTARTTPVDRLKAKLQQENLKARIAEAKARRTASHASYAAATASQLHPLSQPQPSPQTLLSQPTPLEPSPQASQVPPPPPSYPSAPPPADLMAMLYKYLLSTSRASGF